MRTSASAFLALSIAIVSGCASTTATLCDATGCATGSHCVVGRCRADGAPVVEEGTRRLVLAAKSVAVLSTRDTQLDAPSVSLGARSSGDVTVLMRFDSAYSAKAALAGAFLVLNPDRDAPGPTRPIDVEVVEILSDWSTANISVGRTPSLSLALARVSIPPAHRTALRVDVTEAVARSRGDGYGFALVASGDDPVGAAFIAAANDSSGPRLELYLK